VFAGSSERGVSARVLRQRQHPGSCRGPGRYRIEQRDDIAGQGAIDRLRADHFDEPLNQTAHIDTIACPTIRVILRGAWRRPTFEISNTGFSFGVPTGCSAVFTTSPFESGFERLARVVLRQEAVLNPAGEQSCRLLTSLRTSADDRIES
jgi:hypothetical protein